MTFFHFPFHELFKILFATNKRPVMLNISFFPFVFMSPLGDRPLRRETCQNIFSKDDRNIKPLAKSYNCMRSSNSETVVRICIMENFPQMVIPCESLDRPFINEWPIVWPSMKVFVFVEP